MTIFDNSIILTINEMEKQNNAEYEAVVSPCTHKLCLYVMHT